MTGKWSLGEVAQVAGEPIAKPAQGRSLLFNRGASICSIQLESQTSKRGTLTAAGIFVLTISI